MVFTLPEVEIYNLEHLEKLHDQIEELETDLAIINNPPNTPAEPLVELFGPMFKQNLPANRPTNVTWFVSFSGEIDGWVICIVLLPIICIHLFSLLLSIKPPIYQVKEYDENFHNVPTIPLIFLQQTAFEKSLKRPKRNTVEWYANRFVIRVTDNLVYLSDLYVPIVSMELTQNPWQIVRLVNKFNALYKQSKKNVETATNALHTSQMEKFMMNEIAKQKQLAEENATRLLLKKLRREHKARKNKKGHSHHRRRVAEHPSEYSIHSSYPISEESSAGVETTETKKLLDEQYKTWKEEALAEPNKSKKDFKNTVMSHTVMKEVRKHENETKEEIKDDPEHPFDLAPGFHNLVDRLEHQVKEEEQLKKQHRTKSRQSRAHRHQSHHRHSKRHPSRKTIVDDKSTPGGKAVQFHDQTKVRFLNSVGPALSDEQQPVQVQPPEQLKSLKEMLESRRSLREAKRKKSHVNTHL